MARRGDEFDSFDEPWLRRLFDDALGALGAVVVGFFRGVGLFLYLTVTAPLRWMGFLQTSLDDERSRGQTANAMLGAPALVVGVALGWLVYAVASTPARSTGARYRLAAKKALDDGDTDTARVLYERVRLLEPGNVETRYELALLYEKLGRKDLARQEMMQIAPVHELGHPMAHAWLATQIIHGRSTSPEIEVARTHLLRLLQLAPNHPQANSLMAQLDVRSGRYSEAEQRLRTAVVGNATARLVLAKLYARVLQKPNEAKVEADEARRHFEAELRRQPDEHQNRESLAEAYMMLGEHGRAADLMKEGEAKFPKLNYRDKWALVEADWATALPRGDERRWKLFADAFQRSPSHPLILGTLLRVALNDAGDEKSLRGVLDSYRRGKEPHAAPASLLFGLLSVHRGKPAEVETNLKRAGDMDRRRFALAMTTIEAARLSPSATVDLALALRTAWPDRPELRRLHGVALAAAGRLAEALVELESLAAAGARDAVLFEALAEVTSRLGLQEKSEQYKKRAAEFAPNAAKPPNEVESP